MLPFINKKRALKKERASPEGLSARNAEGDTDTETAPEWHERNM